MPDFPPGTIAVGTDRLMRYPEFALALHSLQIPPGTLLNWQFGANIARNLNEVVRQRQGDWLWLLGDDHTFAPDLLLTLLGHDVDLVAPLVLMRNMPFRPVIYRVQDGDLTQIPLHEVPMGGLHAVEYVGSAGLLIKSQVFEALTDPWFELGRTKPDAMGEDLWFCHKAREAGYTVYVDCDQRMGHTTPCTILPERRGEQWSVCLQLEPGQEVHLASLEYDDELMGAR